MCRWGVLVLVGGLVALLGVASGTEPAGVLVEAQGQVQIRRARTARWFAARVNMPLYSGDTVRVGHDSHAAIWFPDGTLRRLKAGARWTVQKQNKQRPCMWQELWVSLRHRFRPTPEKSLTAVAAARTWLKTNKAGLIALAPRNSRVLDSRPQFDWQPVPGAQGYRITIGFFDAAPATWETIVKSPPFRYPSDAPTLTPGKVYLWKVEAIGATGGDSAWFTVVPPAEARDICFTLQRLRQQGINPSAYAVMAASFLRSRQCYSDGIHLIWQILGRSPQDPAVQTALAELYDLVGLSGHPAPINPVPSL